MTFDLIEWLSRSALPLWGTAGVDARFGSFVESLDLTGRPLLDAPRRAMVQARQIFVYAEAERQGWYSGAALAMRAAEAMVRVYHRDDGGWIFAATREGHPVDETRDLYAQATVLLALAHLKRLTGLDRWLTLADETLAFLDKNLATPNTGGYAEAIPTARAIRRQNPHMHLLEALLALDSASPGGAYRHRAECLLTLFESRFLHGSAPIVVELYDDELIALGGPPYAFEPGHHFEWAWLLSEAASRGLIRPLPLAGRLCEVANRIGAANAGPFFDEVGEDGRVRAASFRLWPIAEAIRAAVCDVQTGNANAPKVSKLLDTLSRLFLTPAARGCWIDRLHEDGRPHSDQVPASSLYHIVGAASAIAQAM